MVVKKRAKKRAVKAVIHKTPSRKLKVPKVRSNLSVVVKNLFLFISLSVISFFLYKYFFKNSFLISFFEILAMIFGFMAVGFLIVFLVLIVLRLIRLIFRRNVSVKSKPVPVVRRKGKSRRKKETLYALIE